jgi:hypothetical protein
MMPLLRQVFLFLVALAALAIVLMMIRTADAAELNQGDRTRQIVVEASALDKGADSTDLTAESGAAPAQTLAADQPAPTVSQPAAESDQDELTDRQALTLAQLYALYLSTVHRSYSTHGYSYNHGYGYGYGSGYTRSYDDCDD